jgi:hypothetical protein
MYDYQLTRHVADAHRQDLIAHVTTGRRGRTTRTTEVRERRGLFGLAIRRGGPVALAR